MIIKRNKKSNNEDLQQSKVIKKPKNVQQAAPKSAEENLDIFNDIAERQERRRGDRRRGYRRVDDRTLVSRAQEEANAIKEKAAKEGFQQGLDMAKQEIDSLKGTLAGFLQSKELALQEVQQDIAFIALKATEKIIKKEVSLDNEVILGIISDIANEVGKDENKIIIRTNPNDTDLVREKTPQIFQYGNTKAAIRVIEDKDIEWGSCIVETNNGVIDARFSTQLEILKNAFTTEI